jgi:putative transposase
MKILKSLKIEIKFTKEQAILAAKHCGVARHAYNWGVAFCEKQYREAKERGEKPTYYSAYDLQKLLVAEVKSKNEWYYEVSSTTPAFALVGVEAAYKRFFNYNKTKKGIKVGKPKFKKKGVDNSFTLKQNIHVVGNKIKLPKFGWVKMTESHEYHNIKKATISQKAGKWFASFHFEFEPEKVAPQNKVVGVDLGIKQLATLSDGTVFESVKPYKKYKRKLRIEQRKLSKKFVKGQPQSNNYKKQQKKVAKLHYKIANIRKDALHKTTTYLAKNHSKLVIEDLNVQGMTKNHKLASAILDSGFYEFRRQLEYKAKWYGCEVQVAPRFFASSKTCSSCGSVKQDLTLKDRVYKCDCCGHEQDRDLNAAINLQNYVHKKKNAVAYTV